MSNLKKYVRPKGQSPAHLYQDEGTKLFWAVIRVGRKIRKRNLKTKDYVRALAEMPAALADLGDPEYQVKAKKTANVRLLADYWDDLRKEKVSEEISPATLKRADTVWKHDLKPYLGNWRPDQVTSGMAPDYVLWHKRVRKTQLLNAFKYMGNLFNYMERVGALERKQIPQLKLPKTEKKHHDKKKGRIATDTEVETILGLGPARMRLINGVLEALGMRVMEFVSIDKDRILLEDGRYFLELTEDDTKTGLARILPVPRHLEGLLKVQMAESGDSDYLFPAPRAGGHVAYQIINKEWRQVRSTANISGRLRLHDWRHRRATLMAKANINPIIACTLLGMSLRVYQRVYARLTGRDLVATVDQMFGEATR